MRFVIVIAVLVAAFVGCKTIGTSPETESTPAWDQIGEVRFNSHSEITKDALLTANRQLKAGSYKVRIDAWTARLYSEGRLSNDVRVLDRMGREELNGGFFPERHIDDGTGRTQNRLQEGNIAADLPKRLDITATRFLYDAYCATTGKYLGVALDDATCKNLPNLGSGQPLHFTREFTEVKDARGVVIDVRLTPAFDSCRKSLTAIEAFTFGARDAWRAGQKLTLQADMSDPKAAPELRKKAMKSYEQMYLFLGVAAHAIEDSFAPAHAQRLATDWRQFTDICYYYDNAILTPARAGACAHAVGAGREPRDSIYFAGNDVPRRYATEATTAFLRGFAETVLNEGRGGTGDGMRAFLDSYFTAGSGEGMGFFRCESLRRD